MELSFLSMVANCFSGWCSLELVLWAMCLQNLSSGSATSIPGKVSIQKQILVILYIGLYIVEGLPFYRKHLHMKRGSFCWCIRDNMPMHLLV